MQRTLLPFVSILVAMALILSACAQPVPIAPEEAPAAAPAAEAAEGAAPAPDQITPGGIWIRGELSDPSILNPILSTDTASSGVHNMLFPSLIGQDPFTG